MNLKDVIKERGYSISSIARETGIPTSTMNDIVNGKVSLDNVSLGKCAAIADRLGLSLDELYNDYYRPSIIKIADDAEVITKNQKYYLRTAEGEDPICHVNRENAMYVKEFATWRYEERAEQRKLDELMKEVVENAK